MSLIKARTGSKSASWLLLAFAFFSFFSKVHASPAWTDLARKVGESEENRASVIAQLRKVPNLRSILKKSIYSKDRPLALDTISALELKDMVGELLFHVPADPDGFLTVAINSMMDAKNQTQILKSYSENLSPSSLPKMSAASIVAQLEPLGRLSVVLPPESIALLQAHPSPEVRSSTLYYVRVMGLRNKHFENVDTLSLMLKATEFQLRLQAVSIAAELMAVAPKEKLPSREALKSVCDSEKTPSVKSACLSFLALAPRGPASAAPEQCKAMEDALYSKSTLRVRMVFGYKDARPARFVGDRHERLAFIERVTSSCGVADSKTELLGTKKAGGSQICGFVRSHDNADLFMKKISIRGRERKVLLWVVNSSVGTDDQENATDPFQRWKSKYAELAFNSGLRDADVVMYDGHSRFGGGPDFASPRLADDGTVDPSSYQTERPGLTKMLSALKESVRPKAGPFSKLKMLGLFSCSSSQHFTQEIHEVSKAGIVASKVLMYYSDALAQSLSTLDDVLKARCPRSIGF